MSSNNTTATNPTNNVHALPRPTRIVDKYSNDQIYRAAFLMDRSGGGFASAIANAFFRADGNNKLILLDAFAHLFERFIEKE